eukprot:CAMPEP_0180337132 /NCGR_PEP_ID=MMETSP0988-20121125/45206_1 /TAXON_ID=697907 /ORGANISM="non described non described, Strain CCMP2293" /LENGTH=120 /DNA_ID=CAMNT_0022325431 /DNA_START=64 /DNA_END=427 /DNA_ORIENTATION=+
MTFSTSRRSDTLEPAGSDRPEMLRAARTRVDFTYVANLPACSSERLNHDLLDLETVRHARARGQRQARDVAGCAHAGRLHVRRELARLLLRERERLPVQVRLVHLRCRIELMPPGHDGED